MVKIKWKKIIQFKWFKRLYVLYIFGFVLNLRLSLPFFYKFLIDEKQFSEKNVVTNILPTYFYSACLTMIPVFFFMELLKCNIFIIITTIAGIIAECLYIWTDSSIEMEVAQAFYGCMTAAETAYFVSIYVHSDIKNYQRRTSYIRVAPLIGRAISAFLAQLFISFNALNSKELHYCSLGTFILSAFLCFFLPQTVGGIFKLDDTYISETDTSKIFSVYSNLRSAFPNKFVVKWTLWSVLSVCGYNQLSIYIQPLWAFIQSTKGTWHYNGVLEGVYALFAITGTILGGYANFDWKFKGDLILCMCSLVEGFMLLFISQITNVILNCLFYLFLGFIYHFILTVLYGEIAKFLSNGCFGFVFGFINLAGWCLSSAMVCLINSFVGLELTDYQALFMIYGFFHLGIAILFILIGLSYWFAKHTYQ